MKDRKDVVVPSRDRDDFYWEKIEFSTQNERVIDYPTDSGYLDFDTLLDKKVGFSLMNKGILMRLGIPFALTALLVTNAFSAVVIDDFSQGTSAHTSVGKQNAWDNSDINVLGGIRNGSVGCELSTGGTTAANITADGKFEVTTNWKASPSIYLGYDATDDWGPDLDTDPFNGVFIPVEELTESGVNNSFAITFTYAYEADPDTPFFNDFLFTVQIDGTLYTNNVGSRGTDAANDWMDDNYADLSDKDTVSSATFLVPFSGLTGTGTLDMSKVQALSLHICSANYDLDYTLDSITTTIPEPATALLLAIGGGLTWLLRLKQRC